MTQKEKELAYYKDNCEEELMATPISVLRYISILETYIEESKASEMLDMLEEFERNLRSGYVINKNKLNEIQQLIKEVTEI